MTFIYLLIAHVSLVSCFEIGLSSHSRSVFLLLLLMEKAIVRSLFAFFSFFFSSLITHNAKKYCLAEYELPGDERKSNIAITMNAKMIARNS